MLEKIIFLNIVFIYFARLSTTSSIPFQQEANLGTGIEGTPDAAFKKSDGNADGSLTFDEFLHTDEIYTQLKRDEFRALDRNGNGRVERSEFYPLGWPFEQLNRQLQDGAVADGEQQQVNKETDAKQAVRKMPKAQQRRRRR